MFTRPIYRRRRFRARYVLLVLAVVVLAPKVDMSKTPQLTAFLNAVGLGQVQSG